MRDYSVHGGAFPLTLTGLGCVGSISISGAPQKEDHQLLVSTLAIFSAYPCPPCNNR
ncbi:heme-binding protein [Serratia nematodiphila]